MTKVIMSLHDPAAYVGIVTTLSTDYSKYGSLNPLVSGTMSLRANSEEFSCIGVISSVSKSYVDPILRDR